MDVSEKRAAERRIKRAVRAAEKALADVNTALKEGRDLGLSWRELGDAAAMSHMAARDRVRAAEKGQA